MSTDQNILVVDDNIEIRELLADYLEKHSFQVSVVTNGREMRFAVKHNNFDLIILDIILPGEDGLNLCRYVKEISGPPVIILTAMTEDTDCVVGLELGADDYITKPFVPRVLLARIKAVLRRIQAHQPKAVEKGKEDKQPYFSHWTVDIYQQHLIRKDGLLIPLSNSEFTLLQVFLKKPKEVLSRDQLLNLTKGLDASLYDRSIDNQISRLRKKIETEPNKPKLIKTVWGGGYLFTHSVSFR